MFFLFSLSCSLSAFKASLSLEASFSWALSASNSPDNWYCKMSKKQFSWQERIGNPRKKDEDPTISSPVKLNLQLQCLSTLLLPKQLWSEKASLAFQPLLCSLFSNLTCHRLISCFYSLYHSRQTFAVIRSSLSVSKKSCISSCDSGSLISSACIVSARTLG